MDTLFGIPMSGLAVALSIALACVLAVVAGVALRNRVLLKLALRNIPRRRGRTALIVVGLMLGTVIIAAAFSTGDTMTNTIRTSAVTALGNVDEVISVKGTKIGANDFTGAQMQIQYFDQSLYPQVRNALNASHLVAGAAPIITENVGVQDATTRQNEPRAMIFATDPAAMAGLGEIKRVDGARVSLADLASGEVYLNGHGRDELNASPGDQLTVFSAAGGVERLTVKAIVEYNGTGTDQSAVLMPLAAAQEMLGKQGQIKHIFVSNGGSEMSGVGRTDDVIRAAAPALTPLGLEMDPTKKDALDLADELGNGMTTIWVTFGTFSIVAGILLIFLIFVMLAAERKTEMGIARAVGSERSHLVQMFVFEGLAYDLLAAAAGALLGLAVAAGMVYLIARAFSSSGISIRHDIELRSVVVAYTMGVLLTFVVVAISAWRVSVLNIVAAIRDLPEAATRKRGRAMLILGLLIVVLGVLISAAGLSSRQAMPFFVGISLVIIAFVPLLRRAGLADRAAYTIPGAALAALWLLPFDAFSFFLPDMSADFTSFIASGIMVVTGATWVVMYNSDLLLGVTTAVVGRVRWLAPVVKTAIAYPLKNRFRTGMTLAMFTLIVFTLVVMATTTSAFTAVFNDENSFGGGFQVRATTVAINPVNDMAAAVRQAPDINPDDIQAVASQSVMQLEALQAGTAKTKFESYPVRGLDGQFLANNTYGFAMMARGYNSAGEVWQAIARDPTLAVVDPLPVPTRENYSFEFGVPDFTLEGVYMEDKTFSPIPVDVHDPQTGKVLRLTIIGVLKDDVPPFMIGISTAQSTLASSFGERAVPTVHFFKLRPGVDAKATAKALESAFLMNGMQADSLKEELAKSVSAGRTFNYILQGFMGLGLVVGVAALGVISARSVVERRQEIGVMRSIGFERRMVQVSFLMESTFVAVAGIVLGSVLGLIISFNVIRSASKSPSWEDIGFDVPWLNLAGIFLIVYLAALATTYLPARAASRVYPAEALRYR